MSRARDVANLNATVALKAPLASPDFTGTVDFTGTTVSLDDDEISLDKVSGGTLGAGALGSSVVFPAGHWVQSQHQQIAWDADNTFSTAQEIWAKGTAGTNARSLLAMTLIKANARVAYWATSGTVTTAAAQQRWKLTVIGRAGTTIPDDSTAESPANTYKKVSDGGDYQHGQESSLTLGDAMDWGVPTIHGVIQCNNTAGQAWVFAPIGWNDQAAGELYINPITVYQRGTFMIAEIT